MHAKIGVCTPITRVKFSVLAEDLPQNCHTFQTVNEKFKYHWRSSNFREKSAEIPAGNKEKCTGGKIVFQMCASLPGICGNAGTLAGKILTNSPERFFFRKRLFPTNGFERKWEISPGTNMKSFPARICYYLSPFKFRLPQIFAPFIFRPFNFRPLPTSGLLPFNFRPPLTKIKSRRNLVER